MAEENDVPAGFWRVRLLGDFSVRDGDIAIPMPAGHAARRLFALMALSAPAPVPRDQAAAQLFPHLSPGPRVARLRKVLTELKSMLKHGHGTQVDPFSSEDSALRLNAAAFDIDVWRLRAHVEGREWQLARACDLGDLPAWPEAWMDAHRGALKSIRQQIELGQQTGGAPLASPLLATPANKLLQTPGPVHDTAFFGREVEIEELHRLVLAHRVVTIFGSSGLGKSRVAARVIDSHPTFLTAHVSLVDCTHPRQVMGKVRAALGLGKEATRRSRALVLGYLRGQRALLLLDHVEHLAGKRGDALLKCCLRRLPGLHLLLTSSRRLGGPDEATYRLPTLPLPSDADDLHSAAQNPAVALFVNRAHKVRSDFELTDRKLKTVVEICRLLDGLPLALELAAGWAHEKPVKELELTLRQGGQLGVHSQRSGLPERHLTLADALNWSWRMLAPRQQLLLQRLTVFADGWTPEQAVALASAPDAGTDLRKLVELALVTEVRSANAPVRHRFLSPIRDHTKKTMSAHDQPGLRRLHSKLFHELAAATNARQAWPDDADLPNIELALREACAEGNTDAQLTRALAIVDAMTCCWRLRGASSEITDMLGGLARRLALPPIRRVRLHALTCTLLLNNLQGADARWHAQAAKALASDDGVISPFACAARADVLWRAGRTTPDLEEALGLAQEASRLLAGRPSNDPDSQYLRARLHFMQGGIRVDLEEKDATQAMRHFEDADAAFAKSGDPRLSMLAAPGFVAALLAQPGHEEQALQKARGYLEQARARGDAIIELQMYDRMSKAYQALGQPKRSIEVCQQQCRVARERSLMLYAAFGAWNQCEPWLRLDPPTQSNAEFAVRLMAFAGRMWALGEGQLTTKDDAYIDEVTRQVAAVLAPERVQALWAEGLNLTVPQGVALAAGDGAPTVAG